MDYPMDMDCPWFLRNWLVDGRWWWENVAHREMHRAWDALMRECDEWRARDGEPHAVGADILAAWSVDDAVGASAAVVLRNRDGYGTDRDGPCVWDRDCGSPPPWWTDGIPAELVRRINGVTFRIERAYYGWVYGPMLREYYSRWP